MSSVRIAFKTEDEGDVMGVVEATVGPEVVSHADTGASFESGTSECILRFYDRQVAHMFPFVKWELDGALKATRMAGKATVSFY